MIRGESDARAGEQIPTMGAGDGENTEIASRQNAIIAPSV